MTYELNRGRPAQLLSFLLKLVSYVPVVLCLPVQSSSLCLVWNRIPEVCGPLQPKQPRSSIPPVNLKHRCSHGPHASKRCFRTLDRCSLTARIAFWIPDDECTCPELSRNVSYEPGLDGNGAGGHTRPPCARTDDLIAHNAAASLSVAGSFFRR